MRRRYDNNCLRQDNKFFLRIALSAALGQGIFLRCFQRGQEQFSTDRGFFALCILYKVSAIGKRKIRICRPYKTAILLFFTNFRL